MNDKPSPAALRILLVDDGGDAEPLRDGLAAAGFELLPPVDVARPWPRDLAGRRPDVVVLASAAPGAALLARIAEHTRDSPCPVVVFTGDAAGDRMEAALAAGVSAYVVDGASPARLAAVIAVARARFRQQQALRAQVADLENRLGERKVVERAKGLLMARRGLSEDEAYRTLRRMAMDRNVKLADIARQVLAVAELLG